MIQHYIVWKQGFTTLLQSSKEKLPQREAPKFTALVHQRERTLLSSDFYLQFSPNKGEEKRERKKTLAYFLRRWLYNNLDSNPLILNLERHIKIVREILKSTDAGIHTPN